MATFSLPAGTVTLLMSDIDRSTRSWEAHPDTMRRAVPQHSKIVDDAVARHAGVRPVEQGEGDSIVAVFSRAADALEAALEAQRRLAAQAPPDGIGLSVRIALHTADAQMRDEGNYFGVALSRCARIRAAARGGQILLSRATHDLVVDRLPAGVTLLDCGTHRLRDLGRPEQIFALLHPDLPAHLGAAVWGCATKQSSDPADELRRTRAGAGGTPRRTRVDATADVDRRGRVGKDPAGAAARGRPARRLSGWRVVGRAGAADRSRADRGRAGRGAGRAGAARRDAASVGLRGARFEIRAGGARQLRTPAGSVCAGCGRVAGCWSPRPGARDQPRTAGGRWRERLAGPRDVAASGAGVGADRRPRPVRCGPALHPASLEGPPELCHHERQRTGGRANLR